MHSSAPADPSNLFSLVVQHERENGECDNPDHAGDYLDGVVLRLGVAVRVGRARFELAARGLKAPCSDQAELPPP
jgi:hypothetical protein